MKEVILAVKKLIVVMKIALADAFFEAAKVEASLGEINVQLSEKRDMVALLTDEVEYCKNANLPEWEKKYKVELEETFHAIDLLEEEKWELGYKLEDLNAEISRLVEAIESNKKFLKETRKKGKKKMMKKMMKK